MQQPEVYSHHALHTHPHVLDDAMTHYNLNHTLRAW